MDAFLLQFAPVSHGQHTDAAHIVIDDPHVHTLRRLALEDLVDLVPHDAQADDKVFNKDEVLGTFQGGKHIGKHIVAQGIILDLGVGKDRIPPFAAEIAGRQYTPGIVLFETLHRFRFLGQQRMDACRGPVQFAPQPESRPLVAPQKVQNTALHRHDQKQRHPADLEFRFNRIHADEQQAHYHTERRTYAVDPGHVVGKAQKQKRHPHHLAEDQKTGQHNAAEHCAVNTFQDTIDLAQGMLLSRSGRHRRYRESRLPGGPQIISLLYHYAAEIARRRRKASRKGSIDKNFQ